MPEKETMDILLSLEVHAYRCLYLKIHRATFNSCFVKENILVEAMGGR